MTDLDLVTIKDRDVPIKKLNETQMMLLVREARVLRSEHQPMERKLRSIAFMLDIVESALVNPDDQEWLMGLAGTGQIEFGEMLKIATPFEQAAQAATKPVKRVRAAIRNR